MQSWSLEWQTQDEVTIGTSDMEAEVDLVIVLPDASVEESLLPLLSSLG